MGDPVSQDEAGRTGPQQDDELTLHANAADAASGQTDGDEASDVPKVEFGPLPSGSTTRESPRSLDLLLDVKLHVTAELGRKRLTIKEALSLGPGSVVELDKVAGEPVDLLINDKLIARGEVVVIEENFGVRITEVVSPAERMRKVA